jgi:hypothetical protein
LLATNDGIVYPDGSCLNCTAQLATGPAFTPDAATLTFVRDGSLTRVGVDGLYREVVIPSGVSEAVWSANGQLAAVRYRTIWAGAPGRLRSTGQRGHGLSWSPDGGRVAFIRAGWVYLLDLAHPRQPRRLVRGTAAAFAPDGRGLAVIGRRFQVELVTPRGGPVRVIRGLRGRSLDWQPRPTKPPPPCALPSPSKLLLSQPGLSLTETTGIDPNGEGAPQVAEMACYGEKIRWLESFLTQNYDNDTQVSVAAASGQLAALANDTVDSHYGGQTVTVKVFDLRSGRPAPTLGNESAACGGTSCSAGFRQLLVGPEGTTAGITYDVNEPCASSATSCETVQANGGHGVRLLDAATSATTAEKPHLTNLALSGRTVTWLHDGVSRTATLS